MIDDHQDEAERRRVLLAEAKAQSDATFEQQLAYDHYVDARMRLRDAGPSTEDAGTTTGVAGTIHRSEIK